MNHFDVIVVGSGMSGGIAAKEFCEKGYKTLVLDRGEMVKHREYETEFKAPWQMPYRGEVPEEIKAQQYIQKKCYIYNDFTRHHLINDVHHPYVQKQPFIWYRSSKVGGKSLIWGRQSYRWCKQDFEANAQDKHGIDWPIRYDDIEPWYDYIEPFVGIAGSYENLPQLPDGNFLPAWPLNIVERDLKASVEKKFPGRHVIPARMAHLTDVKPIHAELGRGRCQARGECQRGCSFGGYYSSNSAALPAAEKTGNLTLIANAHVQEVVYDENSQKARGVRYVDSVSGERVEVSAKVVFMCASTVATVQILLNSKSKRFPHGIANDHDLLGRYIIDHCGGVGASGEVPGHLEHYYKGRRPGGIYIPRFRNLDKQDQTFSRGYGFQGGANRPGWQRAKHTKGFGKEFKDQMTQPGNWRVSLWGFGEFLPNYNNRITLDASKTDRWGMPAPVMDVAIAQNERAMIRDMSATAVEMLEAAGLEKVKGVVGEARPGGAIHEMGGACMGNDSKSSYLNKWNQAHKVYNVFIADGAAFSSGSCVNPSITFMAFAARAADFADHQLKSHKL